jgi:hypothetical protein
MMVSLRMPKKGVAMSRKKTRVLIVLVALVFASACSPSGGQGAGGETSRAPTIPMETQVALIVASTLTARADFTKAAQATRQALFTSTPAFTFTPSSTATPTYTPTPIYPTVSVSVDTNCRTGPNTSYDLLGLLKVGEKAEVVGKSTLSDTLVIKLPSNPAITCWLWARYATLSGDISGLPVVPIPPSPTPKYTSTPLISFDVSYISTILCDDAYRVTFKIVNTGKLTWESNRVTVTDQKNSVTKTVTRDNFLYYSPACVVNADQNLESGEVGFTTSEGFGPNPEGHAMSANIQVCSENGMGGTCKERMITFTP